MAIKVIAQRRVLKIGKNPGVKKFVMRPDLSIPIQEKKVLKEASTRSGISVGVMKAGLIRNDKVLGSPQTHPTNWLLIGYAMAVVECGKALPAVPMLKGFALAIEK